MITFITYATLVCDCPNCAKLKCPATLHLEACCNRDAIAMARQKLWTVTYLEGARVRTRAPGPGHPIWNPKRKRGRQTK